MFTPLELLGYVASVLVAVSLMMKSIVRLRWYNLFGAVAFAVYGLLIPAYPVFVVNGFIAVVDIYYLWQLYMRREMFDLLEIPSPDDAMYRRFIDFYKEDISRYFPAFSGEGESGSFRFFILRNMVPVALFIGQKREEGVMTILLDYAIPHFRDLKSALYLYKKRRALFLEKGIHLLEIETNHPEYTRFLRRIGFEQQGNNKRFYLDLKR